MPGPGAMCPPQAVRRDGYWLVQGADGGAEGQDRLAGRYLAGPERDRYAALAPAARCDWLLGRVAVKDAVRDWMGERGAGPVDPADVRVWNEPGGRPRITAPGADGLSVSIAHRAGVAVAAVGEGQAVGVDVEVVEPRSATFVGLMMRGHESRLGDGRPVDQWVTAVWTAKEAVAKAAGTGLRGRPKDWVLQAAEGDWLLVAGSWVRTAREGGHVVATVAHRGPAPG